MQKQIELGSLEIKRYQGEVQSLLNSDFELGCPKIEGKYRLEVREDILNLCRDIERLGGRALLVGGFVRDAVMNEELGMELKSKDCDIEVYGLNGEDLIKVVGAHFPLTESTMIGKSFQVINIHPSESFPGVDVSLPRVDSQPGVSHKDIVATGDPTMGILEAARRRDITANSLAYDPLTDIVYDPFDGIGDIRKRIIRATDEITFPQDPVRVMRVMQFAPRFGFDVAPETIELCKRMVAEGKLDTMSKNRMLGEWKKLMIKGVKPSKGFEFARETGIVERFWKPLHDLQGVPQEPAWHPEGDVWEHTMQVVDVAAEIARRENLDDDATFVLVSAALYHDIAKPAMTKFEDGAIRSRGHEEAGGNMAIEFMNWFRVPTEPKSGIKVELRTQIGALIEDHLKLFTYYYEENVGAKNRNGVFEKSDRLRALRKLAARLGESGTNIAMLSLLTEADQRGRNGDKTGPLTRDQVKELDSWQNWLIKKMTENNIGVKAPVSCVRGEHIALHRPELKHGPWIGVVARSLYLDQLEMEFVTLEQAQPWIEAYIELFRDRVAMVVRQTGRDARDIWNEIRKSPDPREYLQDIE